MGEDPMHARSLGLMITVKRTGCVTVFQVVVAPATGFSESDVLIPIHHACTSVLRVNLRCFTSQMSYLV